MPRANAAAAVVVHACLLQHLRRHVCIGGNRLRGAREQRAQALLKLWDRLLRHGYLLSYRAREGLVAAGVVSMSHAKRCAMICLRAASPPSKRWRAVPSPQARTAASFR